MIAREQKMVRRNELAAWMQQRPDLLLLDVREPYEFPRAQLNDERVSRFHLKIQEDQNKYVLTDLESTNGTKVNGESVKLWLLRFGDVISVGRTALLFGSPEEIAQRLAILRGADLTSGVPLETDEAEPPSPMFSLESEFAWGQDPDARSTLHTLLPPDLPEGLSAGQSAQLTELLHYLHLRLRGLTQTVNHRSISARPHANV